MGFSLESLRCRDPAFPPLYSQRTMQRCAQLGYRFKKASNKPKATWNTSQCESVTYLSLSGALVFVSYLVYVSLHVIVFVFCLALFRRPPLHVHFISACAFLKMRFISTCSDWYTARPGIASRVCTLVFFIFQVFCRI